MAESKIKKAVESTIQHNVNGDLVGYYASHTYEASDPAVANVSQGTIVVKNSNGVCYVKTINLTCTPDVKILDCRPYFGAAYEYDDNGGSGIFIDAGWLYFKEANIGNRILTFIL